jgi:hypothetical protein
MSAVRVIRAAFACEDSLIGPARAMDDGGGAIGAVMGRELAHDAREIGDREMDRERGAAPCEARELLAHGHGRGADRGAREDDRLRDAREREFRAERSGGGGESRHARRQVVGDAERVEPPHLLADRAIEREIAGMDTGDVEVLRVRRLHLRDDLVEGEGAGVDDARSRGRPRDHGLGHQRARIETDRAALDEAEAAHGDEVRRTRPGADEMDRHGRPFRA